MLHQNFIKPKTWFSVTQSVEDVSSQSGKQQSFSLCSVFGTTVCDAVKLCFYKNNFFKHRNHESACFSPVSSYSNRFLHYPPYRRHSNVDDRGRKAACSSNKRMIHQLKMATASAEIPQQHANIQLMLCIIRTKVFGHQKQTKQQTGAEKNKNGSSAGGSASCRLSSHQRHIQSITTVASLTSAGPRTQEGGRRAWTSPPTADKVSMSAGPVWFFLNPHRSTPT